MRGQRGQDPHDLAVLAFGMVQARRVSYRSLSRTGGKLAQQANKHVVDRWIAAGVRRRVDEPAERLERIGPEAGAHELRGDALELLLAQIQRVVAAVADRVLIHRDQVGVESFATSGGVAQLKLPASEHE